MKELNNFITEAFREVHSQQVIDVDKIGKKPEKLPAALSSMYQFLTAISDTYDGPTQYYADDETLDIFHRYFSKNENYSFIVPDEQQVFAGTDFIVKTPEKDYRFKVLLSSNEVKYEDYACIIPYKEDGKVELLNNENIDYFVWKVPNRNNFFMINRVEFFKYLETLTIGGGLLRIQNVKGKVNSQVVRISNSLLNKMCFDAGQDVIIKLSTLSKDVYLGDDLKQLIERQKEMLLKK